MYKPGILSTAFPLRRFCQPASTLAVIASSPVALRIKKKCGHGRGTVYMEELHLKNILKRKSMYSKLPVQAYTTA